MKWFRADIFRRRAIVLTVGLALLAVYPTVTHVFIQSNEAEALIEKGEGMWIGHYEQQAFRGSILDRSGRELAMSALTKSFGVDKKLLIEEYELTNPGEYQWIANVISDFIDIDVDQVAQRLTKADDESRWVQIADGIEPDTADEIIDALVDLEIGGAFHLKDSQERVNPAGESALRIIGRLGPDGPAEKAGIERAYNEVLTGTNGKVYFERGVKGNRMVAGDIQGEPAIPGNDVQLTLDLTLQHEVEEILRVGTDRAGASEGVAIVGIPATGEILAAASVERDEDTGEIGLSTAPLVFSSAYQAGSVFKVVTASTAVESGMVNQDTRMEVPWFIDIADRRFVDEKRATETMSVADILARSSNVGTIKIAQMVGREKLYDALRGFGFGATTGIGHPAESTGLMADVSEWTAPDAAAASIGTYQTATVLQLWAAYNVVANDGMYVPPRLVDAIIGPDGTRSVEPYRDTHRVISPDSAEQVTNMLEEVIERGTGKKWGIPGYSVAAKTGTSRIVANRHNPEDGYLWEDGNYHHSAAFSGFLPASRPQVSITVLLYDVSHGLMGSSAAGPVFSDLARLSIRELNIAPDMGNIEAELDDVTNGNNESDDSETRSDASWIRAEPATRRSQESSNDD